MSKMSPRMSMRLKRKGRIRKNLSGTTARPRLSVFRSAKHIYAQIIDDLPEIRDKLGGLKKKDAAREVGKLLADKAKSKGIEQVVFDRNGFLYHGRIKSLADSCRENGLVF
jgi:large subunit ribosomal protein L18